MKWTIALLTDFTLKHSRQCWNMVEKELKGISNEE